jgi:hypothetical protein
MMDMRLSRVFHYVWYVKTHSMDDAELAEFTHRTHLSKVEWDELVESEKVEANEQNIDVIKLAGGDIG